LRPDRADLSAMTQVTGFKHEHVDLPTPMTTPTEAGTQMGLKEPWGPKVRISPLFTAAAQRKDSVLATYSDGSPAVVVRGRDVFVGTPSLTSELVRALAKLAGVHLYAQTDAAVWAAGPFLSIHAVADGPLQITTGSTAPVCDALDGARIGLGPRVALPIKAGQTRVLRIR